MVKIATIALSMLITCSPGLAAHTSGADGKNKTAVSTMSIKKKTDKPAKGTAKNTAKNAAESTAENSSESTAENSSESTTKSNRAFNGREEPNWVYHLSQAKWHCRTLKENVMIKVSKAIEERAWTQTQAAKFLGVSQPRISDIMQGHSQKFTLDALIEMLFALDKPVQVVIADNKWGLSNPTPVADKEKEDAIEYFSKVIKLDPKDSSAYAKRANAYRELKKFDLAIGDYTRCIELDPDSPGPRNQRALAYEEAGQYKAALQEYDDMLRLFPEENSYQNRALLYQTLGEYDKALADASKAIEMDPQRPGPWVNRAFMYERMGKIKEAISDYENTLKADPTYKRAKVKLDELRAKQSS